MKNCVQIWFNNVTCYVDIEHKQVYSAKLKLLKGLRHPRTPVLFYIIKYAGYKKTKSIDQLVRLAQDEISKREN